MTDPVDALEADGDVERRKDPADARSSIISLTAAGAEVQAVDWKQNHRDIARVFADLTAELQQQLLEITPSLTAAINERLAWPPRPHGLPASRTILRRPCTAR